MLRAHAQIFWVIIAGKDFRKHWSGFGHVEVVDSDSARHADGPRPYFDPNDLHSKERELFG
jgi:hypothetical protein